MFADQRELERGLDPFDLERQAIGIAARDSERGRARVGRSDAGLRTRVLDREGDRTAAGAEVEGFGMTLKGCAARKFASDIFGWTPIGDEGLVFLDTLSPDSTVNEASLRYAKATNAVLPSAGTVVQARAGLEYATLLPALPAVVYTITSNTSADGLYVNGTLPFMVTPTVPPPDGGTDTGSGTDAGTDTGTAAEAGASEAGSETGATEAGASEAGADSGTDAALE